MDGNFNVGFRTDNKKKYRILPFFLLDQKETKNQGSEFNFVRKILYIICSRFVANNFNSFLKLDFSECSYRNYQNSPVSVQ